MAISGAEIVAEVEKFAGSNYVYGAAGPNSFDCSGLVQFVLTTLGVANVPRTSEEQYAWAIKESASDLQPGDLVFAQFPGDNASPGHVGIYVGNGKVLSAEDPNQGVGYSTLASWGNAVVGYGRVPGAAKAASGASGDITTDAALSSGLLGFPTSITQFFSDADDLAKALMWLFQPSSWVRIGAFMLGVIAVWYAFDALMHVGSDGPIFGYNAALFNAAKNAMPAVPVE